MIFRKKERERDCMRAYVVYISIGRRPYLREYLTMKSKINLIFRFIRVLVRANNWKIVFQRKAHTLIREKQKKFTKSIIN